MRAGSATDISGLYYTGTNSSGGLGAGGSNDANWEVTYASVGGSSYNGNSTYTGSAYVVSGSYIDAGWVQNTSSAQWIVPPGAKTAASGGTTNTGGDYLPGNGTTGTNTASYLYRLAFTIIGTGSGKVNNDVSISLTIAADDQYEVYVNPRLNGDGSIRTNKSTLAGSATNAWNNTSALYLQNYNGDGHSNNASFVIGTNYIYVLVTNTNSITGSSGSAALNPSGLLVYQVGALATIDGSPIPEVGTVLPVVMAIGLFGWRWWRRKDRADLAATA
ncbi:MAG: hypothetical protein KBF26_09465 [Opitutaceae bacterium]|nr:hypothetical protein [Opitutaceae bacterium]